jgi:hypothetical protein
LANIPSDYSELKKARLAIKYKDYEAASKLLNGKLGKVSGQLSGVC